MTGDDWLTPLLRPAVERRATTSGFVDVLDDDVDSDSDAASDTSRPFDGLYGTAYSAMIRRRRPRRAFFSCWGDARPLFELDDIVHRVAVSAAQRDSAILDVPCGRGVVAEMIARSGLDVHIVGLDLSRRALEHAARAARHLPDHVEATYLRGTALDLPLRDGSIGTIVSINGLHVMPDHARFVQELARVLQPGGEAWLITAVSGGGARSAALLRAGRMLGVLSRPPPHRAELVAMVEAAGFQITARLGGTSIVGLLLTKAG